MPSSFVIRHSSFRAERGRRVLVVLGMHRGGTSAVAGMLHRMGVDFGPRLMPANADNPAGYYEHNDVVNLHDRFLGRLGVAWDDPFPPEFDPEVWPGLSPSPGLPSYRDELLAILRRDFIRQGDEPAGPTLWGVKDPRLCLLLPWWEPVWKALDVEPSFVIVLRSPEAVVASLERRDGFSPAKSNLLWLQHLLRAERGTRGRCRGFVDYDGFLADWRGTLDRLGRDLGVAWPRAAADLSPGEASFLDPALRHHAPPSPDAGAGRGAGFPWVQGARSALFSSESGAAATLDGIHEELRRASRCAEALGGRRETDLASQLQAQRRLTRWYEEEWQKAVSEVKILVRRVESRDKKIRSLTTCRAD